MFHGVYEALMSFAAEGRLGDELPRAKEDFVARTGEMFESDPSFERRLALFLEWYVLDRPVSFVVDGSTPADLFVGTVREGGNPDALASIEALRQSWLSLFEFKRAKPDTLHVVDILTGKKHAVFERRRPAGLEPGDILEARIVPYGGHEVFTEAFGFLPREARKAILKVAKAFRKGHSDGHDKADRIAVVHRVTYFGNRAERYKHVDPRKIFEELGA